MTEADHARLDQIARLRDRVALVVSENSPLATYVEASLNLEAAKIVYEAAREAYLATAKV